MPLDIMSPPNAMEPEAQHRKRSHEDFSTDLGALNDENSQTQPKKHAREKPVQTHPLFAKASIKPPTPNGSPASMVPDNSATSSKPPSPATAAKAVNSKMTLPVSSKNDHSTNQTQSAAGPVPSAKLVPAVDTTMSEARLASAASVNAAPEPSSSATTAASKKSRPRLTPAEKDVKAQEAEQIKARREAERKAKAEAKAVEEARKEAEKRAKAEAKEEERKRKAEAKEKAEAERAAKAQERAEKKRQKEEEERKTREAKEKKAKAQPSIASFFGGPRSTAATTPKKAAAASSADTPGASRSAAGTPTKAESNMTEYEQMKFKPFYVHSNMSMAVNNYAMDDAAREAKSRILDDYISGSRGEVEVRPFKPVEAFRLPGLPAPRGRSFPSVKKLMQEFYEDSGSSFSAPVDLTNSTKTPAQAVEQTLKTIPFKVISFTQDVRPPYRGTVTSEPSINLRKLAKNPTSRGLAQLNYDYDSEAEWFDDGEGDDLDDGTDDEDDVDADDDMAGFLDDSEDVGLSRLPYSGDLQPESTGICFEDENRLGPVAKIYKHRLEFITQLDSHHGIDPFSTSYWMPEPQLKAPGANGNKPAASGAAKKEEEADEILKGLSDATIDKIKAGIVKYNHVNKTGLVNCIASEVMGVSAKKLTKIVMLMADQTGPPTKKVKKTWRLRPRFQIKTSSS